MTSLLSYLTFSSREKDLLILFVDDKLVRIDDLRD